MSTPAMATGSAEDLLSYLRNTILAPPPKQTCCEWAEDKFYLSTGSEKGEFRAKSFQREPLDCISDPRVNEIVIMACTQVIKTTVILIGIAYAIAKDPDPIMAVFPRDADVQKFSKYRLAPILRDVDDLRDKVGDAKSRVTTSTIDVKDFPGGPLIMTAAGSPGNLASFPIRYVFCDEVDKFDASAGAEGDPIDLVRKRQATYRGRRKTVLTCSPTVKDHSRIAQAYEVSDQRQFWVRCPYCTRPQLLKWGGPEEVGGVKWDTSLPIHEQPRSALYECEHCQCRLNDNERWTAVDKGYWVARRPFAGVAGFHISELYSHYKTLADIVDDYLKKKDNPLSLQTFINTSLAELWSDPAEVKATASSIEARAEAYGPEIPREVAVLTAGCDIQANRIEALLVGWGKGEESWTIEHRVFLGDPSRLESNDPDKPSPWQQLDGWLNSELLSECDVPLHISAMCVDAGYNTATVAQWCGQRFSRRVWATIGRSGTRPIWPKRPGRTKSNHQPVFVLGVDSAKQVLYSRLQSQEPGPGFTHFPKGLPMSFFEQLTAEERVADRSKPMASFVWRKKSAGSRNEILDCFNNAYGAMCGLIAAGVNLDREVIAMARIAENRLQARGALQVPAGQPLPAPSATFRPGVRAPLRIKLGGF